MRIHNWLACPRPSRIAVIAPHGGDIEPACLAIVTTSEIVLALHGSAEQEEVVHVGGCDARLARKLCQVLNAAGFAAQLDDTADHPGRLAANICNRGRSGRGCQLEISNGLRLTLFEGLKRQQREHTTAQFEALVAAVRTVLLASSS